MSDNIKKYLNHIQRTCPELTDEELKAFSSGLTVTKLNKGDFYINAGQTQSQGGFLIVGLIRAFYTDNLGNDKTIYFVPENDYTFHYASFIDNKPSPLSFQCLEPSIIICFTPNHLQNAYRQLSKFDKYGRLIVETKLKMQQERLESLLYKNAEQRYVDFTNQFPQLLSRISISHLCSYLGVERQTLTRIRKKLSRAK